MTRARNASNLHETRGACRVGTRAAEAGASAAGEGGRRLRLACAEARGDEFSEVVLVRAIEADPAQRVGRWCLRRADNIGLPHRSCARRLSDRGKLRMRAQCRSFVMLTGASDDHGRCAHAEHAKCRVVVRKLPTVVAERDEGGRVNEREAEAQNLAAELAHARRLVHFHVAA